MLLPKRVKRRKRIINERRVAHGLVESVNYDFVEADAIVSKVYQDELGESVSVTTNVKSIEPLELEHIATIDGRKTRMADCTYRNALELMLYRSYKVVNISGPVSEDGEVFYRVTWVSLSPQVGDGKRRTLQTKVH